MALTYVEAPNTGALRQGEILGPLWTHHPSYPPIPLARTRPVAVASTVVDLTVVLSPDCDLLWDHEARFEIPDALESGVDHPNAVSELLVCGLQSYGQIRPRFEKNRPGWTRVDGNQDERYHHLEAAPVVGSELVFHDLFLDFKTVTSVRTYSLYAGIGLGSVQRFALIPEVYVHDLIQRYSAFLSRIAIP